MPYMEERTGFVPKFAKSLEKGSQNIAGDISNSSLHVREFMIWLEGAVENRSKITDSPWTGASEMVEGRFSPVFFNQFIIW